MSISSIIYQPLLQIIDRISLQCADVHKEHVTESAPSGEGTSTHWERMTLANAKNPYNSVTLLKYTDYTLLLYRSPLVQIYSCI